MSKNYQQCIRTLKQEEKLYNQALCSVQNIFADLNKSKDKSLVLIDNIVKLLESIRKAPITYTYTSKNNIRKIKYNMKIISSNSIENEKKQNELIARSSAIMATAISSITVYTFKNYIKEKFKGKNIIVYIIGLLFIALIWISYLFYKRFKRIASCKKIIDQVSFIKKERLMLENEFNETSILNNNIIGLFQGLNDEYNNLKIYQDYNYSDLNQETIIKLNALVNNVMTLLALLNNSGD